jgi:pilus assembly protein Flp/PilA
LGAFGPVLCEGGFLMLKAIACGQNILARSVRRDDRGASAVEYGLLIILIAFVIIGAVTLLGKNLNSMYQAVATAL